MLGEKLTSIIMALRNGERQEYEIQVRACSLEDSEALWSALGAAHGCEVDLVEQLQRWPSDSLLSACYQLLPAIGKVPALTLVEAQGLLEFAERLDPTDRYLPAVSLQPHIARAPTLGIELGELLRSTGLWTDGVFRVWALAFSGAAPQEAASFAQRLATGAPRDTQMLAALLLFLPFDNVAVRSSMITNEGKLAVLLRDAAPQLEVDAWVALTSLAEVSPTAMSLLNDALKAVEPHAIAALSNWLHRISTPTVGAGTFLIEHLVSRLLALALKNEQFRAGIDSGIASLFHHSELRPLLLPCMLELGVVDGKVAELFKKTFDRVCDKTEDFAKVLTIWLLNPDTSLPALGSLLSRCTAERVPSSLDVTAFTAASSEQRVKAARRILAMTHHGPTLCQFIACIAEMDALGPEGLKIAAEMLDEAFVEYPSATENFLKPRTRASSRNERHAAVYRGVYANALRWRQVLVRLPTLKELSPTDSELYVLRSTKRRVNRDILRGVAARSIFAGIFTNVHLAQGRRFASHTQLGPPQVVEMAQTSHSTELPSSELADPMRGMLLRRMLLRDSR